MKSAGEATRIITAAGDAKTTRRSPTQNVVVELIVYPPADAQWYDVGKIMCCVARRVKYKAVQVKGKAT